MQLHKLVDGIRVDLTEQEVQETLAQWEENRRIAEEAAEKVLLESLLPSSEDKMNALLSQVDYWNKTQDLPVSEDFEKLSTQYEKLLHDKRFKEYKEIIEAHKFKQHLKNPKEKTVQELFRADITKKMEDAQKMAHDAKQSNEEITKVLQEIKDALGAIQGFMMIIPQVYQSLQTLQENLKPKE